MYCYKKWFSQNILEEAQIYIFGASILYEYEQSFSRYYFIYGCFNVGHELEPFILFRVMEVLHSAYKAGHIQIADYISFFITLLSRFQVYPGTFWIRLFGVPQSF